MKYTEYIKILKTHSAWCKNIQNESRLCQAGGFNLFKIFDAFPGEPALNAEYKLSLYVLE